MAASSSPEALEALVGQVVDSVDRMSRDQLVRIIVGIKKQAKKKSRVDSNSTFLHLCYHANDMLGAEHTADDDEGDELDDMPDLIDDEDDDDDDEDYEEEDDCDEEYEDDDFEEDEDSELLNALTKACQASKAKTREAIADQLVDLLAKRKTPVDLPACKGVVNAVWLAMSPEEAKRALAKDMA